MRLLLGIVLIFGISSAMAQIILADNEINLKSENKKIIEQNIDDIDIEKYIKSQINSEYVPVSLDECILVALRNNFEIKINYHDFLSSKYEYQNKLAKLLPYLNTNSYIADYRGQILVGGVLRDDFRETALSLNITGVHELTRGGEQIFEAKAAKYFEKSKNHNLNFSKSQIIYNCAKYYYQLLLAKINTEIYLKNLIEIKAQLELAKNLKKTGVATNFDVIRSKGEELDAKAELLNAINNFITTQSKLANILGIEVNTPLMPIEDEVKVLKLVDENKDIDELLETAINLREDLKEIKDLIFFNNEIKKSYITEFFPKPLIEWQEQWQGTFGTSIKPSYIATVYMTWNLGENLGVGTITKIKKQKEEIKIKILEWQNKLRNIEQELISAKAMSKYSKSEIEISTKRIEYTKESVKLAMEIFNKGDGILLDIIEAQTEATKARAQKVKASINYNISQLNIIYNTGTISAKDIIEKYKE